MWSLAVHFRVDDTIYKWQDGIAYMRREPYFDIQENVAYPSKWVRVNDNPSLHQLMAYEGPLANGDYSVMLKEHDFTLVQSIANGELLYELTKGGTFRLANRVEVRSNNLWVKGVCVRMTPALKEFLWEVE